MGYRSRSFTEFLDVVRAKNYLVLDTETTGLHTGEICQIAIINSGGEVLLDTLVKTINPIPPEAYEIHGISDDDVRDSPTWESLNHTVLKLVTGHNLIVYNAVYDRKMMHQSAETSGLPKTEWKVVSRWYCAMEAFAEFYGDWNDYHQSYRWQKLSTAASHFKIPVTAAHSALGDCLMTLAVIEALALAVSSETPTV